VQLSCGHAQREPLRIRHTRLGLDERSEPSADCRAVRSQLLCQAFDQGPLELAGIVLRKPAVCRVQPLCIDGFEQPVAGTRKVVLEHRPQRGRRLGIESHAVEPALALPFVQRHDQVVLASLQVQIDQHGLVPRVALVPAAAFGDRHALVTSQPVVQLHLLAVEPDERVRWLNTRTRDRRAIGESAKPLVAAQLEGDRDGPVRANRRRQVIGRQSLDREDASRALGCPGVPGWCEGGPRQTAGGRVCRRSGARHGGRVKLLAGWHDHTGPRSRRDSGHRLTLPRSPSFNAGARRGHRLVERTAFLVQIRRLGRKRRQTPHSCHATAHPDASHHWLISDKSHEPTTILPCSDRWPQFRSRKSWGAVFYHELGELHE